jgi:hypothetical protein
MNLWIFDNMAFVVLHVSVPYKSTDFTFELKIQEKILRENTQVYLVLDE